MSNYRDYNGSPIDYDRNTGILDSGNRQYNKRNGIFNPKIDLNNEDIEFEPEMFDEDCW